MSIFNSLRILPAAAVVLSLALSVNAFGDAQIDKLKSNLAKMLPGNMAIETIEPSPMEHVYIVTVGAQTLYVYSKGDHVMIGDVYDAERQVNLGEERKGQQMSAIIEDIPQSEMILMGEAQPRHVTVFTDTDCVYCQRFNTTVAELEKRGMQVRYLMFPRAGIDSPSYHEAVSVWCAEDQAAAITLAKAGGTVEPKSCDNPVAEQYALGQQLGVRGTPTMILDNGTLIPGFLPPDELLARAGLQ